MESTFRKKGSKQIGKNSEISITKWKNNRTIGRLKKRLLEAKSMKKKTVMSIILEGKRTRYINMSGINKL